jgi:hypothetical protein
MFFCNYLRRRALRNSLSKIPTAIIPITDIRSATVLLDASDPACEACTKAVQAYFKSVNVKVRIIYVYLEKLEKDATPPVDRNFTLLRRDLDWCGRPSLSKLSLIFGPETDLFISLEGKNTYQAEFIASCIPARFKVGRFHLPVYDIVCDGTESLTQTEVFRSIEDLFTKIK